jgi:hypothetical protein
LTQQLADDRRRRAADADVHFIENQRRGFHLTRGDDLNRQRNTRQFAAGGHFSNRLQRLTRVSGDAELDMVGAFGREMALIKRDINGNTRAASKVSAYSR